MSNGSRRLVFFALLAFAVPVLAALPEVLVGGTVSSPAPLLRNSPAAGTDGSDFFVVWYDGRTPNRGAIVGTRVKRSGQIVDPLGIRIASGIGFMSWPAVVWDGAAYVVVWTQGEYRNGIHQEWEVYAARVDRDGRVVTAPRLIADDAMTTTGHYAESNGSVTVIAYRIASSTGSRVAVLDREGNVVHREALTNRGPGFLGGISVAATPSRFLVAWSSADAKLSAMTLTSEGRVARTPREIGTGEEPVVATDGTSFTLVSRRWLSNAYQWVLMGCTLDAELAQVGDVQPLANDEIIESVSLLWRGDRYEVIAGHKVDAQSAYGLLSIELDRDGDKLASRRRGDIFFHWGAPQPVAVTNGSDVLVAYTHPNGNVTEIVARVYRGSSPAPEVEELLSWSGNAHAYPDVASSASGHLVAWTEQDGVYAARIDAAGRSLDGRGVQLTRGAHSVRAAFDGTNYVVAWLDNTFIGVRSIAPATGATVAEVKVPALVWEGLALAASPDATYLAFVTDRIQVTRIPHATRTPELPIAVSPEEMAVENPELAWNGSELLVVWDEYTIPRGDPPIIVPTKIHAARVTGSLSLLDPAPILLADIEPEFSSLGPASVASNGNDWLVVASSGNAVVARRVLRNGNAEGASMTKIADGFGPDVTWDGTRYAVAYKAGDDLYGVEHTLLLGTVPATGTLPMMRRTLVSTGVVSPPSMARTPNGDVALAYTKVSFLPEHTGVERSHFRVMDVGGRGRVVRR